MLILLSPAKIQNFEPQNILQENTLPAFLPEASQLVDVMKKFSAKELENLLQINPYLARQTADRYYNWSLPFTVENAKQTILVFNGEVFHGLDAKSFSVNDFEYAQSHLRVFSGLYGVLCPFDLIQPYRLDVGTKLLINKKNLYYFWRDKLTQNILQVVQRSGSPVVNLMSNEYFKVIDKKKIKVPIIDIEFLESKNDSYKPIVVYTKKARGLMARYIIQNKIEDVEHLKAFSDEGYWYNHNLSTQAKLVFTRA